VRRVVIFGRCNEVKKEKTYYEANIKQSQKIIKDFINSKSYTRLTPTQTLVADNILQTILTSEYLICEKSNRTIAAECDVCIYTVNKVRLLLRDLGLVKILLMPNKGYKNLRYILTLDKLWLKEYSNLGNLTPFKVITHARIKAVKELGYYDLDKLVNLKYLGNHKRLLREHFNSEAIKNQYENDHYSHSDDLADLEAAIEAEQSKQQRKPFLTESLPDPVQNESSIFENAELSFTSQQRLLSRLLGLVDSLHEVGFSTIPCQVHIDLKKQLGRKSLKSYRKLSKRKQKERLEKYREFYEFNKFSKWLAKYGSEGLKKLVYDFEKFGSKKTKAKEMLVNVAKSRFHKSRLFNGLGVLLPKGMICLDFDYKTDYAKAKALIPDGFWTTTRRGYHCFVWDKDDVLNRTKIQNVDIIKGDKMVMFDAYSINYDKPDSEIDINNYECTYKYISGSFDTLGSVPKNFEKHFEYRYTGNRVEEPEYEEEDDELFEYEEVIDAPKVKKTRKARKITTERFKLPPYIENGTRNDTLFRFGRSLKAKGHDDDYISLALESLNDNTGRISSLRPNELNCIIRSVISLPSRYDFQPKYERTK
jgi:hypothetical protein